MLAALGGTTAGTPSAVAGGSVVNSAYRAKLSVAAGALLVEEFTRFQNRGVRIELLPATESGVVDVRIGHGRNTEGTRETNFPLGAGCTRLAVASEEIQLVRCTGVQSFAYRPRPGMCCAVAPLTFPGTSGIPLPAAAVFGSGSDVFHIGWKNGKFGNTIDAGAGGDTLVVSSPELTIRPGSAPLFRYVDDGIGNDGFDGFARMNLRGFERFDLFSGPGRVVGGKEADTIRGGGADDPLLSGGEGDDTLTGGGGSDTLDGGAGDDIVAGHAGNDTVTGGPGSDLMRGNEGTDVLLARDDTRDELIDCGGGLDRAEVDLQDPETGLKRGCEVVQRMAVGEAAPVDIARVERRGATLLVKLVCPVVTVGTGIPVPGRCSGELAALRSSTRFSVPRGESRTVSLGNVAVQKAVEVRSVERGRFGAKTVMRVV